MNNRKTFGELINMWKLNNIFKVSNGSKEIKVNSENTLNETKDTTYQNLWEVYSCKMPITRKINYFNIGKGRANQT